MHEEETIKSYVVQVLEELPATRNNDTILQFNVLKRMGLAKVRGTILKIDLKDIDSLPSFESIRRIRQQIQSTKGENRLLPSEEVEKQRHKKEEQYRENYSNKKSKAFEMPNSWMIQ